jgi:putative endonuclease
MYSAYVLYSENFKKHYYSFSSDIDERLISHNHLSNKDWTRRYRPWKLIHTKYFPSKSEAMKYERWLKSGKGRDFIKTIPH